MTRRAISLRRLALLPVLITAAVLYRYWLEIPAGDYWDALAALVGIRGEGLMLHLAFYWAPFVDHRHFFPEMTIDLLGRLMDNQHYALETALGFAFRLGVLYLLWAFIRKSGLSERNKTVALLFSAFSLFWPLQLFMFQYHWYSTTYGWSLASGILAIYFLHRFWGSWAGIGCAGLASWAAAFSHGHGLPLSIAIGLALVPCRGWSVRRKVAWWLISLAQMGLFFYGYPSRRELGFPPLHRALYTPLKLIEFFFRSFAPPMQVLLYHAEIYMLVGLLTVLFCAAPVLLLYKKNRLFKQEAFPWLVLILWSLSSAALSALGRSAFQGYPSSFYYMALSLLAVAGLPLWLDLYPNLWPVTKKDWLSRRGALASAVLALLMWVYITGAEEGIQNAAELKSWIKWNESYLSYYPALDNAALDNQDNPEICFNDSHIQGLYDMNALPDYVDATPFTIEVPTAFQLLENVDVEVLESGPDTFKFTTAGGNPQITLKPSVPVHKKHVVSFAVETSGASDLRFCWSNEGEWYTPKCLTLSRKYLFSVGLEFVEELNRREVSEALREQFRSRGRALIPPIRVEVEQAESEWRIIDANTVFSVRNEDRMLNVYSRNGTLTTTHYMIFPEASTADRHSPVGSIVLEPVNVEEAGTQVTIRELKVLTR